MKLRRTKVLLRSTKVTEVILRSTWFANEGTYMSLRDTEIDFKIIYTNKIGSFISNFRHYELFKKNSNH